MFDIALLQSGFSVADPREFYQKLQWLIAQDMGLDPNMAYKEPEVEVDVAQDEEEVESLDED